MSRKPAAFGQPKPLPGQAGFKVTTSDLLEKDSLEMEQRLKMLQEKLAVQAQADAALPKVGGSRWRSARGDKGSVTAYAKDVQERHKKKSAEMGLVAGGDPALLKGTAPNRRAAREATFRDKDVSAWTVKDVSGWLEALSLPQYAPIFAQNEISGPVVLDMSLEDLDYMEITILGHRKTIIKSIEDLRINRRMTMNLTAGAGASSSGKTAPVKEDDRKLRSQTTDDCAAASEAVARNKTHWSHIEPISSNIVDGSASGMVNPADGVLDEEAEREAFRLAVLEWRGVSDITNSLNEPKKLVIVREYEAKKSSSTSVSTLSSVAQADLKASESSAKGPSEGVLDEEAEREAFRLAVLEWRGGGGAAAEAANGFDDEVDSPSPRSSKVTIVREYEPKAKQSQPQPLVSASAYTSDYYELGALGGADDTSQGAMWKNPFGSSESPSPTSQPRAPSTRSASAVADGARLGDGQLDEEQEHKEFVRAVEAWRTGQPVVTAAVHSTVERLKSEFEAEQQSTVLRLQREKEEALKKWEESQSASTSSKAGAEDLILEDADTLDDEPAGAKLTAFDDSDGEDYGDVPDDDRFEMSHSFVEVNLVESILGVPKESAAQSYLVDEGDDDV